MTEIKIYLISQIVSMALNLFRYNGRGLHYDTAFSQGAEPTWGYGL